jgi:hypothetical protein
VGNLLANDFLITAPEPLHRLLDGFFRHSEFAGHLGVGPAFRSLDQESAQRLKQAAFARRANSCSSRVIAPSSTMMAQRRSNSFSGVSVSAGSIY